MELTDDFALVTLHRAENTDNPQRLGSIVKALNSLENMDFVLPLHPRTRKMLEKFNLRFSSNIHVVKPVGYFTMLDLENRCTLIITDSGGVQKEAYFFRKPCITMRDQTEWIETVQHGWNVLVGADQKQIVDAIGNFKTPGRYLNLYGSGKSGREILDILDKSSQQEQ